MAISLLTDSEKKAFEEVYGTTRTKIEALRRRVEEIPGEVKAEIEKLRQQQAATHEVATKSGNVLQSIASIFKFAGGEMERHYPSKKR